MLHDSKPRRGRNAQRERRFKTRGQRRANAAHPAERPDGSCRQAAPPVMLSGKTSARSVSVDSSAPNRPAKVSGTECDIPRIASVDEHRAVQTADHHRPGAESALRPPEREPVVDVDDSGMESVQVGRAEASQQTDRARAEIESEGLWACASRVEDATDRRIAPGRCARGPHRDARHAAALLACNRAHRMLRAPAVPLRALAAPPQLRRHGSGCALLGADGVAERLSALEKLQPNCVPASVAVACRAAARTTRQSNSSCDNLDGSERLGGPPHPAHRQQHSRGHLARAHVAGAPVRRWCRMRRRTASGHHRAYE